MGTGPRPATARLFGGVYVNPQWRGLGVAEALIDACIGWGKTQGVVTVKLAVVTTNTPAIRCYTRCCGFCAYGVEPQAIYYDGVYYDELLLVRSV